MKLISEIFINNIKSSIDNSYIQKTGYLVKKGIPSFNQMAKNLITRFKK